MDTDFAGFQIDGLIDAFHYANPRPESCRGAFAARLPSRRLCAQISSPVFPSSAITDRRVPPVVYKTPLTMSGVPSNLYSGNGPRLSVLKRQATSSLLKFEPLIWSSGRYLVPRMSAVYEA